MAAYTQGKTQDRDAWINVQKKTFTRWANNHLKKRNIVIEDLYEDVKSGVVLLNLLEVIGGESVKTVLNVKYNKTPKMKLHMLENGNQVLNYVKAKGLTDLVNIGSNDFVDGNSRIILGFLWKVILRFVVSEDGQKGLLLWCQLANKPYDNVKVKNFHRSWNDGLAFVGVIHKYRPDLIADPTTLNPEDAAANCELAFSVAEEKLGGLFVHQVVEEKMETTSGTASLFSSCFPPPCFPFSPFPSFSLLFSLFSFPPLLHTTPRTSRTPHHSTPLHTGISRLLDVEDVAGNVKPDDKSIATYMNEFYLLFATQMQADHYIDAIIKACAVTRRHDDMIAKYNEGSSSLISFLSDKNDYYSNFEYGSNTEKIREQLMEFYEYRNTGKPPMAGLVIECQGNLNSLRSSCKSNMRPVFEPADELQPEAIENQWKQLDETEAVHEARLRDLFLKFQDADFAADKFDAKADKFERWADEKNDIFEKGDFGQGVVGAEVCQNSYDIYKDQLVKYQAACSDLNDIASECEKVPEFEKTAGVVDRNATVQEKLNTLVENGNTYDEAMTKHLNAEKRKAELEAIVAKNGAIALYDSEDIEERITEPVVAGQVQSISEKLEELQGPLSEEITNLSERVLQLKKDMSELEELKKATEGGDNAEPALRRASSTGAMNVQISVLCNNDGALVTMNEERQSELNALLSAEEQREQARKTFAESANAVKSDCAAKTKELGTLGGEPEAQMEALEVLAQNHQESELMVPCEASSAECDKLGIVINPYTPETIFTLRSQWEELGKAYKTARNVCEKAIMDKKGTQLTPEQIAEIREVFDYFDGDKDGLLSLKEFQDGCQGMGMVMDEATSEDHYRALNGGKELTFDQFSNFMVDQMKTGTTLDEVISAFRSLASGDTITDDVITQHFASRDDYAQYLGENMPTAEDGNRDFVQFTNELFTR